MTPFDTSTLQAWPLPGIPLDDACQPPGWNRAAWAQQLWVDMMSVEHELAVAVAAAQAAGRDARRSQVIDAVRAHLQSARDAGVRRRSLPGRLVDWWQGTSIEHGFRSVHAARIALVDMLSPDQLRQLVPATVVRVTANLPPLDARRIAVEKLPTVDDPRVLRPAIQSGLAVSYEVADQAHQRVRAFRNILLSGAALITVLMIAFVTIVAFRPTSVPFCFRPGLSSTSTAATTSAGATTQRDAPFVCPSGDRTAAAGTDGDPGAAMMRQPVRPSSDDVLIVAGLGVIGGALASAVAIRKVSGAVTPYSVPTALALLKVPTGALTAVSAILLLGGGFVPGLSELDSQPQILAYALLFGYAQQLATRFLDERAGTLLATLPDKQTGGGASPANGTVRAPEVPSPRPTTGTPRSAGARRPWRRRGRRTEHTDDTPPSSREGPG